MRNRKSPNADGTIGVLLDAAVDLAGLHIGLMGFAAHIPLKQGPAVTFGLDGLELAYAGGPIEIAGSLLPRGINGQDSYDGTALIKTPAFSIAGIGAITTIENAVSVFIFAALNAELGDPPAFRLQGIAGGFGYNRRLILPPVERVSAASRWYAPPWVLSPRVEASAQQPAQGALQQLRNYIPLPSAIWLAAGIKFNSFEMITGVALVSVSFGNDVEIGLLRLAEMSLPRGAKGNEIAYVELALRCSIKPSEGAILVEGRLTDACYIFSKDCRITGRVRFCLWFSGPQAGDFVVTLGDTTPISPDPRTTPWCPGLASMANHQGAFGCRGAVFGADFELHHGGRLAAVYQRLRFALGSSSPRTFSSPGSRCATASRRAWGSASSWIWAAGPADLPAGGSANMGTAFAGQLHVDLGSPPLRWTSGRRYQAPERLTAGEFRKAFLPKPSDVVTARVESGLLLQETREGKAPLFVVSAHALRLAVESAVPLTGLDFVANSGAPELNSAKLGVSPMAKTALDAQLTLSIKLIDAGDVDVSRRPIDAGGIDVSLRSAKLEPVETGVPEALWRPAAKEGELPETRPNPDPMKATTTGIRISLGPIPPAGASEIIRIDKQEYDDFPVAIPALDRVDALPRTSNAGVAHAMATSTNNRRNAILGILVEQRRALAERHGLSLKAPISCSRLLV